MTDKAKALSLEEMETEKLLARDSMFWLIINNRLKIKTKEATLIPLIPNSAQMAFLKQIYKKKEQGKPIRAWVLKARQEGLSTIIEALIYSIASQKDNINALIMASEKDKSNNLFDMSKLYHEMLDKDSPHLAPTLRKSNEKKLEFEDIHSQIIIATAENIDAARSYTYHVVHLSECAFFRDLAGVMSGLNQSVPDTADSIIVGETTANGMNMFYDEWMSAVNSESDWIPVFIPWFQMVEYSKPLENNELYPINAIKFTGEETKEKFLTDETILQRDYSLTDEQINWRRWAIINKCSRNIDKFKQEYPSCWEEAFIMSGQNFFSLAALAVQRKKTKRPLLYGEIFYQNGVHELRELPEGRIKIYAMPSWSDYVITADASEAVGQDEASILVLDTNTNKTVAVVNGQYPPEDLAHMIVMLANYYNEALVVPENKGYGYMVCQLVNKQYGNIYRTIKTKSGDVEETEEIGFNTNTVTRPQMLAMLAEEIKINSTNLIDIDLISQCESFIINRKNMKPEAATGKEDGLVICRAIASYVRSTSFISSGNLSNNRASLSGRANRGYESDFDALCYEMKQKKRTYGVSYGKAS